MGKNERPNDVEIRFCEDLDDEPSLDELRHLAEFLPEIYRDFVQLLQED